jgi:hypothetical protein
MLTIMVMLLVLVRWFLETLLVVLFHKLILFIMWLLRFLIEDFILREDFLMIFPVLFDLFIGSLDFEDIFS